MSDFVSSVKWDAAARRNAGDWRSSGQPFRSFSEIYAAALKALRREIAAAGTAGAGSR